MKTLSCDNLLDNQIIQRNSGSNTKIKAIERESRRTMWVWKRKLSKNVCSNIISLKFNNQEFEFSTTKFSTEHLNSEVCISRIELIPSERRERKPCIYYYFKKEEC